MTYDPTEGWQSKVRNMTAHQRAFLPNEINLLRGVLRTPRREKEQERLDRAYDHLYTKFKTAAEERGQPISADEAEWLVRCHPAMPYPFPHPLPASRAAFTLIKHPPAVIQQHFFESTPDTLLRKTFTVHALDSVTFFEKLAARAPTDLRCFDALHDAALLVSSPDRVIFRPVRTEERLRRWKYAFDTKRITRPPRPKGPGRFKNSTRDRFFCQIVEDLVACGLSKLRNEATDGVTSACDVVARVCGVSPSTVRTVVDKARKRR